MNSITIDEFKKKFQGQQSVAVIGNSNSVLSYNNGTLIDSYSIVVRFNKAVVQGFETRVGTKTDILFGHRYLTPDGSPKLQTRCVVCLLDQMQSGLSQYEQWVGDREVLFTLMPDPLQYSVGGRTRALTTGTSAIFMLLRVLEVKQLLVTGFTLCGAGPGGSKEYFGDTYQNCTFGHDKDHEARMLSSLLLDYRCTGDLKVTPEVEQLLSIYGPCKHKKKRLSPPGARWGILWKVAWLLDRAAMYARRLGHA